MNASALSAQAASLQAINSAKHKAAGKNYRLAINLHHRNSGRYVKTIVFYCVERPEAGKIAAIILKNGGSISESSSSVNAL
jgi:hypothetical protein